MKRETFPCGCIWNHDDGMFDEMCIPHSSIIETRVEQFNADLEFELRMELEGIKCENDS